MLLLFWPSDAHYKFKQRQTGKMDPRAVSGWEPLHSSLSSELFVSDKQSTKLLKNPNITAAGSAANKISQWSPHVFLPEEESYGCSDLTRKRHLLTSPLILQLGHDWLWLTLCCTLLLHPAGSDSWELAAQAAETQYTKTGLAGFPASPMWLSPASHNWKIVFSSQQWCSVENENCWKWSNVGLWQPRDEISTES